MKGISRLFILAACTLAGIVYAMEPQQAELVHYEGPNRNLTTISQATQQLESLISTIDAQVEKMDQIQTTESEAQVFEEEEEKQDMSASVLLSTELEKLRQMGTMIALKETRLQEQRATLEEQKRAQKEKEITTLTASLNLTADRLGDLWHLAAEIDGTNEEYGSQMSSLIQIMRIQANSSEKTLDGQVTVDNLNKDGERAHTILDNFIRTAITLHTTRVTTKDKSDERAVLQNQLKALGITEEEEALPEASTQPIEEAVEATPVLVEQTPLAPVIAPVAVQAAPAVEEPIAVTPTKEQKTEAAPVVTTEAAKPAEVPAVQAPTEEVKPVANTTAATPEAKKEEKSGWFSWVW